MSDTTQDQPVSSPQPEASAPGDSTNWQARYTGLNKTYQQKVGEYEGELTKLRGVTESLTKEATEWKAKATVEADSRTKIEALLAEQAQKSKEVETRAATLEKQLARQQLLMSDPYRSLIPLEAKGLLRQDLEGEAFTNYLTEFGKTLNTVGKENVKEFLAGATDSPPIGTQGVASTDELLAEAKRLMLSGDVKGYDAAMNRYYETLKKQ